MKVALKIKKLRDDIPTPVYAHEYDSGFDLVAVEDVVIEPGETKIVPTGLAVSLPPGFEIQIRPRSGITAKTKLRVQLGTVDSAYRGELGVIVDNISPLHYEVDEDSELILSRSKGLLLVDRSFREDPYKSYRRGTYLIRKGDRIAQAVVQKVEQAHFYVVDELDATERGDGGFGSSGVKS